MDIGGDIGGGFRIWRVRLGALGLDVLVFGMVVGMLAGGD